MFGLSDKDIQNIKEVFKKYPMIQQAILYGSRAKGNYKNGSDIDLTLIGDQITLSTLNNICLSLDELYLPYTFDLSLYSQIDNKDLLDYIKRVGIVFYQYN